MGATHRIWGDDMGERKLARHMAHCRICKSPLKAQVEKLYIETGSYKAVREAFPQLRLSDSMIWRHIRAFGLDVLRRVSVKEFCEIMLAKALENINDVRLRDGLEAAKLLARLGEGAHLPDIWRLINELDEDGENNPEGSV